jgi:hypothetical protein
MPVYKFSFPTSAAGLTATVVDSAGTVVHTEALGSSPDETGSLTLSATLNEGLYSASVATGGQAEGSLDVADSIAASGILTSPNGTEYRLAVANDGTLSTEAV